MNTELPEDVLAFVRRIAGAYGDGSLVGADARVLLAKYDPPKWQRDDVVRDDSGNLFCYHPYRGWFGLESNQPSARGPIVYDALAQPLVLLVRHRTAVSA